MSRVGRAARWAGGVLAGLSARDLAGALIVVAVLVLALCWVLRDDNRSRRLAEILGAWRGRPASAPAEATARQRRSRATG